MQPPDGIPPLPPVGPEPTGRHRGYWTSVEREHWVAIAWSVAVVGVIVAGVALAVWWVTPQPKAKRRVVAAPRIAVVPSSTPTPVVETTASVESTVTTSAPAPIVRASLFAYRSGGAIWVAGEHGGASRTAFGSASGPFSLSPDGVVLAVADSATESMTVIDLATSRSVRVGSASVIVRPLWSPDSQWVVYALSGPDDENPEYVKVRRDGTGYTKLLRGQAAAWRTDGKGVVIATGDSGEPGPLVWIRPTGSRKTLRSRVSAGAVAAGEDRVYHIGGGGRQIRSVDYSGKPKRTVLSAPMDIVAAAIGDLSLSPDERYLAWTETGDDGYSRIWVVELDGGKPVTLSPRRDGQILGWSADGTEVLFVEGNPQMGEATRVMAVRPSGKNRRTLVDGGGL